ncbi:hypothetical protein TrVE_jg290 [Triparma verrucosa]|uniref:Uncharacterized protein n=1 Tax=Triparma verrucosa TaxID=1606542 RepID=A0A9W7FA91_9STRA|nr:hypothetical protein TrVE_jg290 [Triparma verrucosa]
MIATPPNPLYSSQTSTSNRESLRSSRQTSGSTPTTTTLSTLSNYHPLPPLTPNKKDLIIPIILQIAHITLLVLSLTLNWSLTYVSFTGTFPASDNLYPSTFWTNVRNFLNSGALPLALLLLVAGIGQPIIKSLTVAYESAKLLLHLPLSPLPKTFQLITSKYTIISSNVGAVLLTCVTITFNLTSHESATSITSTDFGTAACLLGTLLSIITWCYLPSPSIKKTSKIEQLGSGM